jgi:hypothetical protein
MSINWGIKKRKLTKEEDESETLENEIDFLKLLSKPKVETNISKYLEKRVMIFLITRSSFQPCRRHVLQTENPICSNSGVSFGRLLAGEIFKGRT